MSLPTSRSGRPLIGILPSWDEQKDNICMGPRYLKGLEAAGAFPVILPLTDNEDVITQAAELFDGFLFTGGHDIDPSLYGEEPTRICGETCPARDRLETKLFQKVVMELDKPAFGICRGMQFFNVILGGTLYQEIPSEQHEKVHNHKPASDVLHHEVIIDKEGPLYALLSDIVPEGTVKVNSYHHQGIKDLSPRLEKMATSDNGIVEALYMPERRFVWAVQWHPEYALKEEYNRLLLQWFVTACKQ